MVARALLGCLIGTDRDGGSTVGRIVETEAYGAPDDPASHAAVRRTGRVTSMWGPPGVAYVYRSYGLHTMLNVVTEPEDVTGAVLIRALEPVNGLGTMRVRRGMADDRLLCAGPGRLCQALAVGLDDHGRDLVPGGDLWLAFGTPPTGVTTGSRIGITRGLDRPWRFFETGSRFVSAHRRGVAIAD